MALPIENLDVLQGVQHSRKAFSHTSTTRPFNSSTQLEGSSRKRVLQTNNTITRPFTNGLKPWSNNAMDLDDDDDDALFSQVCAAFESTEKQAGNDRKENDKASSDGHLDNYTLRSKLQETEWQLQNMRDESEKNLGEIHMLRDYLSQQEASEKENVRTIEEKYQKHVEVVMDELQRAKREAASLQTQLQFKDKDVEESHAKLKQLERQLRQCSDTSFASNQSKRPKLSLPEKMDAKVSDVARFPDDVTLDIKHKSDKNSPVLIPTPSSRVIDKGTSTSVSTQCSMPGIHNETGLAGRLATIRKRQLVVNQSGAETPQQLLLRKLLSSAESNVYSVMSCAYSSECRGDILTLQKHPIVISSGLTSSPLQSPLSRPGMPFVTGVSNTDNVISTLLNKCVAPRKHLNFTSPVVDKRDPVVSPLCHDSVFNLQDILGRLVRQESATSTAHSSSLSAHCIDTLQVDDAAELKLLPYLERCVRTCCNTLSELTLSHSKSSADVSLGTPSLSTDEVPNSTLVCLLNSLLVLKTFVDYSPSIRAALLTRPPRLSDFSSVEPSILSRETNDANSGCSSEGRLNCEVDKRNSIEPMDAAFTRCEAGATTSTPCSQVVAKSLTWNNHSLSRHPIIRIHFLTLSQTNEAVVVTPSAASHACVGLTEKVKAGVAVGKGMQQTLTGERSLSEWRKVLLGGKNCSFSTPHESWSFEKSTSGAQHVSSKHPLSQAVSPIEDCASRLLGDVILLAAPKQFEQDGVSNVPLLVPIVCLEIFESLASNSSEMQVDRFSVLITRGILEACVSIRHFLVLKLVSAVLLHFSKSGKMIQLLNTHSGCLKKLFHIWTDQPSRCTPIEWRNLSLQLIQLATALTNASTHLMLQSALTGELIRGLILLLHRELTELNDANRTNTSVALLASSCAVLLLRHGACLLYLLWCSVGSFGEHRAAVDQYYIHLLCSLIRVFQQSEIVSQLEVLSLQEMRDSDQLEESQDNSYMDTT